MPQPAADRNLLFGILAMQMDFITREQLITAMQAWVFDKTKTLGDILSAQKALDADHRGLLDALVEKHLAQHGNDAEKSLAALSSVRDVRQELKHIADADVEASLNLLTERPATPSDPWATVAPTPSLMAHATGMRFRIVRPHARGGLGEVFVARDEELNREVALKEIQEKQADNQESRTRFMLEAEITGGLEHPGIVPVYGLGTYADGRPYYAMRFIRGDSLKDAIDRFHRADHAGMSPGQRTLELRALLGRLVDVCNAIAYAHSRGVLHRDLKPGNIMLGKYGETLVVDWGLAKPLGQTPEGVEPSLEPGEGSLMPTSMSAASHTIVGSAVGTPQYMSPEQAGGRLDQLGPASDVYSLGATLYCVLTGRSPIGERDVGTVLQRVQRGDVPKPSSIKPDVPPALEAICLKAMALKPHDRYASPNSLADDIEHWLADEPVAAYPEPWSVTARRWVGRHATLVTGIASAVAIALISLTIATILLTAANERERTAKKEAQDNEIEAKKQEAEAKRQEKIAREQKDKAMENFRLARAAVDRYHTNVSEDVILNEPGMEKLRQKLLSNAAEFYGTFKKMRQDDPSVQAELGRATYRLALITADVESMPKGIELLEQAVQIFDKLPAAQADAELKADRADCHHHLGRLYRKTDANQKAEASYRKAHEMWDEAWKDPPKDNRHVAGVARTLMGLGNEYRLTSRLDAARKVYVQSLDIWRKLGTADPKSATFQRERATCQVNLGVAYHGLGVPEEAETAFKDALAIQQRLADDFPHISQYQDDLARTHYAMGDFLANTSLSEIARKSYAAARDIRKAIAERHPGFTKYQTNLAETHTALARLYARNNDPTSAEENILKAVAILRKLADEQENVPNFQGDLARGLIVLGEVRRSANQFDQAETAYRDAALIQEKLARQFAESTHYAFGVASTHHQLGQLLGENKKYDKAGESFLNALTWWQQLAKQNPAEVDFAAGQALTQRNLGDLAILAKNPKEAADWYDRAIGAMEPVVVKNPDSTKAKNALWRAYWKRADLRTQLGQFGDALEDWNRVVVLVPDDYAGRGMRLKRAAALARAGKPADAVSEADKLLKHPVYAEGYYLIAGVYALAAGAAENDVARSPEERKAFADKYAARAVKFLTVARDEKFFETPSNLKRISADPDLNVLRDRSDFQKLLKALKK